MTINVSKRDFYKHLQFSQDNLNFTLRIPKFWCVMAFLFSPQVRSFSDETLESYLLRVVAENFFSSYEELSLAIREELHELDFDAHGAFPIDLKRLNVYHAQHNSHFRIRALGLLEGLLDLPRFELQKLALLKSDKKFNGLTAVHRNGVDLPLKFIRYDNVDGKTSIPICPQCLAEEGYIKQSWHIQWVDYCTKHNCHLIHHCPECSSPINYIENESITHCFCGADLSCVNSLQANKKSVELTKNLFMNEGISDNPLFNNTSISQRFATLLWYQQRYKTPDDFDLEKVTDYFLHFPKNFHHELDLVSQTAEMKLIDLFNKTSFNFIFGTLLSSVPTSIRNKGEQSFIAKALINYLILLVEQNPKSKKSNVADILVSVAECAVILDTSHEQIYRLYQEGVLQSATRYKMQRRINPHTGIFYLRQIMEYKTSFGGDNLRMYVSAW